MLFSIDVANFSLRGRMLPEVGSVGDSPDVFLDRPGGDVDHRDPEAVRVRQYCLLKCDGASPCRFERQIAPRVDVAEDEPF